MMIISDKRRKQMNEAQKRYKKSLKGKETEKRYMYSQAKKDAGKRWRIKNPEKTKAHKLLNTAVKLGFLVRLPCIICKNEKSNAHHEDYTKPLDVVWFCKKHHEEHHKNN